MNDEQLLQPLQEYIKPAHSSLLAILPGPALLAVILLFSGQTMPTILIVILFLAAAVVLCCHILERRRGNDAVHQAAERYGAKVLADDFGRAQRYLGHQLCLGKLMLYSEYSHGLWAYGDLASAYCLETTDSDGDKCLELWCRQRSGVSIRVYYTSNIRDNRVSDVCVLINQRIADTKSTFDTMKLWNPPQSPT